MSVKPRTSKFVMPSVYRPSNENVFRCKVGYHESSSGKVVRTEFRLTVKRPSVNAAAALAIGIEIEESDISDLRKAAASTKRQHILQALSQLEQASGNHLRAFSRNLAAHGGTYTPKHLLQADFDKVPSHPKKIDLEIRRAHRLPSINMLGDPRWLRRVSDLHCIAQKTLAPSARLR